MYRASGGAKWTIARPRLSVGIVVPPILMRSIPSAPVSITIAGCASCRYARPRAQNLGRSFVVRPQREPADGRRRRHPAPRRWHRQPTQRRADRAGFAPGICSSSRTASDRLPPGGSGQGEVGPEDRAFSSRVGTCASTVGTAAIASARSRSLGGSCANASAKAGGRPDSSRAISVGESRSRSAKTMSMPRTRGCPWAMRRTSSATKCRGHGHCPYWARLFSSMSTIATRLESLGTRPDPLYQVEPAHAQFGDDAGVDDAQNQGADDQRESDRTARTAQ